MAKKTTKKTAAKKTEKVKVEAAETSVPTPLPVTQVNLLAAQAQIDRNMRGG